MEERSNNGSCSHMSIFDESINDEENINNENENKNNIVIEIKEEKILEPNEKFLGKKRKSLSEDEKKERIEKRKNIYCKINDEIIQLLEKINNDEATPQNIIRIWNLLAKDLSDTKKITNREGLIFNKKNKIFGRLFNLTIENYQFFWHTLKDGKSKEGYAQDINSSNISKAKKILKLLEEKKNEDGKYEEEKKNKNLININSKKNKTIKELIQAAEFRDNEIEKINEEILGIDNDISSDESPSSSSSDLDEDNHNNSSIIDNKIRDIKNEENEEKKRKEKEEKEKKEKEKEKILKQIMEEKDEIDIFN